MSVAFFIVPEREIDGLDTFVDGKAMAKLSEKSLEKACSAAGVKSVYDFVSADPDELGDLLADGEAEPTPLPPEQWFRAEDGLQWASKLAAFLQANPTAIKDSPGVLADLADYEAVFRGLQAHALRWHFEIDF